MEHRDRSIAAEARAVAEGHKAFLGHDTDGVFVRIVSDTTHGKWYRVVAHAPVGEHGAVMFTCRPQGTGAGRGDHGTKASVDGTIGCKHQALAARRLERAGLIRWIDPHVDQGISYRGRWVAARATQPLVLDDLTEPERKATDAPGYRSAMARLAPPPEDPFAAFDGGGR